MRKRELPGIPFPLTRANRPYASARQLRNSLASLAQTVLAPAAPALVAAREIAERGCREAPSSARPACFLIEQFRDAVVAVDAFDGLGDEWRNRKHLDLAVLPLERHGHRVGHDHFRNL